MKATMKAMILAAGRGERMRPLTDHTPKPLLPVAGKRLIEYHLLNLAAAGFKDIVINVAWLGQQIIDTLGDGERYGVRINYSNEGDAALETGGGIFHALPLLGNQPFMVINGDVWCDYPLERLKNFALGDDVAHLVLVNNPEHNPQGDFACEHQRLRQEGETKRTFSGIGIYRAAFFAGIKTGTLANPAFPLAPLIRQWIAKDRISAELFNGQWRDIGTPGRLQEIERQLAL